MRPARTRVFRGPTGLRLVGDLTGPEAGPVVVLLHGGGQTRQSWSHAARALGRRGYRAVTLDARGYGDSNWAPDGDYRLDTLVADLAAILNELPPAAALVGASMGGAAALCCKAAGSIASEAALVLVDIVPRIEANGADRIEAFMRAYPAGFDSIEQAADAVAAYNPHRVRSRDSSGLRANLRGRDRTVDSAGTGIRA